MMEIDEDLKRNLIADVENVCCLEMDEEKKQALMRCFEITISLHKLGASKMCISAGLGDISGRDIVALAEIAEKERGVIIVCGAAPRGMPLMNEMEIPEPFIIKKRPILIEPIPRQDFGEGKKKNNFRKPSKY